MQVRKQKKIGGYRGFTLPFAPSSCICKLSALHVIKEKTMSSDDAIWAGCGAGKTGFGVLHNGDIVPCTSLRNKSYIEGNVKNRRLKNIWHEGFKKFRDFSHNELEGFCSDCVYSTICLGGCSNSRYCINGNLETENNYCTYNYTVKKAVDNLTNENNTNKITEIVDKCIKNEDYQILNCYIKKILPLYENEKEKKVYLLNVLAYTFFQLELFEKVIINCRQVLELDNDNVDALKGLGLSIYNLGDEIKGKEILIECLKKVNIKDIDVYSDVITLLINENNEDEARKIFHEAKKKYPGFLYNGKDNFEISTK
jgi:radical SAM protein with 4Fe4S-binding SPASM domain